MTIRNRTILGLASVLLAGLVVPMAGSAQIPAEAPAQKLPSKQPPAARPAPESCVGSVLTAAATAAELGPVAETSAAPAPTKITPKVPNAAASKIPLGADPALIEDLKRGGYVLFFRHALTNWSERDGAEGDFQNRLKQRNLSTAGRAQASAIGMALKVLEIPIEKVYASPMWRCRDTAEFAFGAYDTTSLLFWKGPTFREARIQWLSTRPAAGKNLVLVGHQDQFIPIVPGLQRDQLKEGDALVIEPQGKGKFRVVRQIPYADWMRLGGIADPLPEFSPTTAQPAEPDTTKAPKDSNKPIN